MIRLRDIRKSYEDGGDEVSVLRGACLEVGEGELVAVMGASGSGKSTLLNVIGGLDRGFAGEATVLGRDLARLSDRELARYRNESVGFVFQSFNLLAPLDALHNVMLPSFFGAAAAGRGARAKAAEALARVGLAGKERRLPARLSGGERQRVALARALFARPRILLADEPTGSLDEATAAHVLELIGDLNRREGLTVILVTHDPRVAAAAGRTLELRDGVLVRAGTTGGGQDPIGPGAILAHERAGAALDAAAGAEGRPEAGAGTSALTPGGEVVGAIDIPGGARERA